MRPNLRWLVLALLVSGSACSKLPTTESAQPVTLEDSAMKESSAGSTGSSLSTLFSHIWRVTKAPSLPAAGSILIFRPSGTLLETSCADRRQELA
jgi:hypothetical protein